MARRAAAFRARAGAAPTLAIVRAGHDPGAEAYLRQIERAFAARDLGTRVVTLDGSDLRADFADAMETLGRDAGVQGILVQLPLPPPLTFREVAESLSPVKDVEGLHPIHAGRLAQGDASVVPSTPLAGLEILRAAGVPLAGRSAVVVGRSAIVGRPMALLLLGEHATVTVCHSRTPDLAAWTTRAEILVAATGRPALITGQMVRPGSTVIDFGINEVDGQLVGDVDYEGVRDVAGAITPVPGGTGPVTTAMLARNLLDLVERGREVAVE